MKAKTLDKKASANADLKLSRPDTAKGRDKSRTIFKGDGNVSKRKASGSKKRKEL